MDIATSSRFTPTGPSDSAHARFEFGENWRRFLAVVDEDRIREAERSLRDMLELDSLSGLSFLDIGSGSGLFSLAAARLGAARVHSLDVDSNSVACTTELRARYAPEACDWVAERASVLDREHMESLGSFDVVYSWGVLHHTGDMWTALDNAAVPVEVGGRLFIAIYNDQGRRSRRWMRLKRKYNELPLPLRTPYVILVMTPGELSLALRAVVSGRPQAYFRLWADYRRTRGMSRWYDIVDWVGGYPFDVASPDDIFAFYRRRGFILTRLVTNRGMNQFVFQRAPNS